MAHRGEMAQVELMEPGDAATSSPDEVDRARSAVVKAARGGLSWVRRHRALTGAAAFALAVAVAIPVTLSARTARERDAALAALPGVLAPLGTAPRVAWTSASDRGDFFAGVQDHAWIRDDVLVVWDQTADFAHHLRALDTRTGDELWTVALSEAADLGDPQYLSAEDPTACVAPARAQGHGVVACVVPVDWRLRTGNDLHADGGVVGSTTLMAPMTVRLRTFDVADGSVLVDTQVSVHSSLATIGGDVAVAQTPDADVGASSLERLDPATAAVRWRVSIPRGAVDGAAATDFANVLRDGDDLAVRWRGGTHVFTADGTPADGPDTGEWWRLRGHRWTPDPDNPSGLLDVDTGRSVDVTGAYPAWLRTDDGSAPEILLLQGDVDGLRAIDVTTGRTAWAAPELAPSSDPTMLAVDGLLVLLVHGDLQVRDLRTGAVAWTLPAVGYRGQTLATDGRLALVLGNGLHGDVVAYDLRDGRRAWTVDAPSTLESLMVVDNRLFALSPDGIVAFTAGG